MRDRNETRGRFVVCSMPFLRRRPWFLFFGVLSLLAFGFAFLMKGPRIVADEVRVYRLLPSRKTALHVLARLQGDAAQQAANSFQFSSTGTYDECLDSGGWFQVVFSCKRKSQRFNVYIPTGQLEATDGGSYTNHLSEESREYWEQLIATDKLNEGSQPR